MAAVLTQDFMLNRGAVAVSDLDTSGSPVPEPEDTENSRALAPALYGELRNLAARFLRSERPDHTLNSTALVHEAYVRLGDGPDLAWRGRTHFFAVAASTMRRILVDQARARGATKRGGGQAQVTLTDSLCLKNGNPLDVLAVHDALTELEALNPRHAKVAEMRFFAGMSFEEIAAVLGVTSRTLKTDWAMARVWLLKQLGGDQER